MLNVDIGGGDIVMIVLIIAIAVVRVVHHLHCECKDTYVGYGRIDKKWGLVVEDRREGDFKEWPISAAPIWLKIRAIERLDRVIIAPDHEVVELAKIMAAAVLRAKEMMSGLPIAPR